MIRRLIVLSGACGLLACESQGNRTPDVSRWIETDGLKAFPPESSLYVFSASEGTIGASAKERFASLNIDCHRHVYGAPKRAIYISAQHEDGRDVYAVMRIDSAKPDTVTWTDLRVPDTLVPRLLPRLAKAKTMRLVYSYASVPDTVTFALDGLAPHLAKMDTVCGP